MNTYQSIAVKRALVERFPGVRFSVRMKRYRGNPNMIVTWQTDGIDKHTVWDTMRESCPAYIEAFQLLDKHIAADFPPRIERIL